MFTLHGQSRPCMHRSGDHRDFPWLDMIDMLWQHDLEWLRGMYGPWAAVTTRIGRVGHGRTEGRRLLLRIMKHRHLARSNLKVTCSVPSSRRRSATYERNGSNRFQTCVSHPNNLVERPLSDHALCGPGELASSLNLFGRILRSRHKPPSGTAPTRRQSTTPDLARILRSHPSRFNKQHELACIAAGSFRVRGSGQPKREALVKIAVEKARSVRAGIWTPAPSI